MKSHHSLPSMIAGAAALLGLYCIGWAVVLLLMQASGWLKFGEWQPIPLHALLVSETAQSELRFFGSAFQPLNAVPAWGWARDVDALALRIAGQMVGVQRIVHWLLDAALTGWLAVSAYVLFYGSTLASEAAAEVERARASSAPE